MAENILNYDHGITPQEQYWDCGPASTQVILSGRGKVVDENTLIREIGTTVRGTNDVNDVRPVLQRRTGVDWITRHADGDPMSQRMKDQLWTDVRRSIAAGFGVLVNWVAPPSNYPRGVKGSISPAYSGGTVRHYVAVMGIDEAARAVWVADPGFSPFAYWLSFDQLATLIPPKGWCVVAESVTATPAPPPAPQQGMTAETLAEAMGCSPARAREMLSGMVGAMQAAQITTPLRAAHWCAQIGHESGGLVYMEEIADGSAYEGRADLGNVYPGDGMRFKGSGPIQLTGRANFSRFSEWCFAKRYTTNPREFVDHPERVRREPKWGFLAASWYWTVARPQLNPLADRDDLIGVTRAINGGTNGLDDRRDRLARCKRLGDKLLPPSPGGLTMDASSELTKRFPSRSKYRASDGLVDTMAGFILNIDARIHEEFVERNALLGDPACVALVKREAAKGDPAARGILAKIGGQA
ncbi:C39 family peptidase [Gordonia sp. QH-12]|uniref:C39 family peptidase n=1 Tax=Gordonia sp. QH-12 TaxID=1437876 RepID=UPI00078301B4|nr:C39 family peptidase [Gordonia sp. QH-12]